MSKEEIKKGIELLQRIRNIILCEFIDEHIEEFEHCEKLECEQVELIEKVIEILEELL